jgi:hypothetical protein
MHRIGIIVSCGYLSKSSKRSISIPGIPVRVRVFVHDLPFSMSFFVFMSTFFFNRKYRLFSEYSALLQNSEKYCYYEIQIHRRCVNLLLKRLLLVKRRAPPPTHRKSILLFWNDKGYVLSAKMRIRWKDYRTILFEWGVRFGICILFAGYTDSGTFIGPPRLERETRIRESPVRAPTGTTTVSGSVRIRTGYEAELSTYDPGIPSLERLCWESKAITDVRSWVRGSGQYLSWIVYLQREHFVEFLVYTCGWTTTLNIC